MSNLTPFYSHIQWLEFSAFDKWSTYATPHSSTICHHFYSLLAYFPTCSFHLGQHLLSTSGITISSSLLLSITSFSTSSTMSQYLHTIFPPTLNHQCASLLIQSSFSSRLSAHYSTFLLLGPTLSFVLCMEMLAHINYIQY